MLRIIRECQPTWVIGENVSGFVNMALDDCWADLEAEGYEVQPFIIPACGVEAHHRRDRCWIVAYSKCHGRSAEQIARSITEAALQQQEGQDDTLNTRGAGESATSGNVAHSLSEGLQGHSWYGDNGDQPRRVNQEQARSATEGGIRKCEFCGHEYDEDCGRYGCPNCEGGGLESSMGGTPDGLPCWMDGFEYIGNPDRFGTPRVTTRKDNRANRLKALGNAVVPQIPEIIGRAILG
jgi:DNA (cytosine-5)-methyltransferase 1